MAKFLVRQGKSTELKSDTLLLGELGFNHDTNELMCGTENGPVKVAEVVTGPENGLYIQIDDNRFLSVGLYMAGKG